MKKITKNNQTVYCHGIWEENSNAACVFDDEAFDGYYCDGANSWEEAVEIITKYAQRHNTTLIELTAI